MERLFYAVCLFFAFSFQTVLSQILLEDVVIYAHKKHPVFTYEEGNNISRYYYYPNLNAYYDSKLSMYIYRQNGEWTMAPNLAPNYRGYSVFNNDYVEIPDYHGDKPYELLNQHQKKYPAHYSGRSQKLAKKREETEILGRN